MRRFTRVDTEGQPLQRLWRGRNSPCRDVPARMSAASRSHARGFWGDATRRVQKDPPYSTNRLIGEEVVHAEHVQRYPVEAVPLAVLSHLDALLHLLQRLARF